MIIGKRKAISNWFRSFKTFVDPLAGLYKIQETVFGFIHLGNFQRLPKVDYVLIFRQFFAKCEACTFEEDEESSRLYYQVSLVYNKNRRIIVHETRSRKEAFSMGESLAQNFNSKIRDSASQRGKSTWLKPGN
ncbi:MAG: hypothetical protein JNL60_07085 [Bacteroidia bacterium]|nr:hypothetical protein [Bacteroidia bacterium]